MGKYDGIMVNKIIRINKTYRNMILQNGKVHTMLTSDSYKDQTGTWITTNTYNLRWFGDYDLYEGQSIKIASIKSITPAEYISKKTNQLVKQMIITIEIYAENQQQNNMQYEPQYSSSSGGYTDDDEFGI